MGENFLSLLNKKRNEEILNFCVHLFFLSEFNNRSIKEISVESFNKKFLEAQNQNFNV